MPTYVYETIPSRSGEGVRRFELKQSMNDAALTHDPDTGLPVRRVISGGFAPMTGSTDSASGCEKRRLRPAPTRATLLRLRMRLLCQLGPPRRVAFLETLIYLLRPLYA